MNVNTTTYKKYMRKLFSLCLVLGTLISTGYTQTKDTAKYAFTLQQAIDYALKNQYSMKNASLDEAIANAKVGETRGIGLPQIGGSIQYTNNDPLRAMFFSTGGGFFAPGSPFAGLLPPGIPANSIVAIPNIFQLPVGADAGATISQMIFNSSYIVGLQAAKTYRELSSRATEQTKIQITEAVTKAYYMVLVSQERLELFNDNVARLDSSLNQTKTMYHQGTVEKTDVDRLQVTYNTIFSTRENFKNLLTLSNVLLKYQMSMTLSTDLSLTEKIADLKVDPAAVNQQMNYSNRIEYSLLQTQKRLNELNLRNNRLSFLPNLSAFANVGEFTQNTKTSGITDPKLWYDYGLFGVTMNVPIFDGFQKSYRVQQNKLALQKSQNDLSNLELSIDVQIKTAEITLANSLTTLEAQNKNMGLASEVARSTKAKYGAGVGSSLEVNTAENALVDAQTSYFGALYDALVAKVDYQKAIGKLNK